LVAGQEEIETAARQARNLAKEYQDRPKLQVFTLYAAQNMYVANVIGLPFLNNNKAIHIYKYLMSKLEVFKN
jgi:hypothetical protein